MNEQMIEDIARAISDCEWDQACSALGTPNLPRGANWTAKVPQARAAHSVMAAKIAELEAALEAISSGEAFRIQRFAEDDDPEYFLRVQRHVQQIARAALAPYPERRSE